MKNLRPHIKKDGQTYVDDPIYLHPKVVVPTVIERSVAAAFGRKLPPPPQSIVAGYERVRLRWMKPDGHGGLIPR